MSKVQCNCNKTKREKQKVEWIRERTETALQGFLSQSPQIDSDRLVIYQSRLHEELGEFDKREGAQVFLQVLDLIQSLENAGLPLWYSGGGISASLVSFLLGLSDVDPIEFGLIHQMWTGSHLNGRLHFLLYIDADLRDEFKEILCEKFETTTLKDWQVLGFTSLAQIVPDSGEVGKHVTVRAFPGLKALKDTGSYSSHSGSKADVPGSFQLVQSKPFPISDPGNSDSIRNFILATNPTNLMEMATCISLIRPVTWQEGLTAKYATRKKGDEAPFPIHAHLGVELKETLGMLVFKEQIVHALHRLGGFSLGEADDFRRRMGKRVDDAALKERILRGMVENGVSGYEAEELFQILYWYSALTYSKAHALAEASLCVRQV